MSCNYTGPGRCECGQSGALNREREINRKHYNQYEQMLTRFRAQYGDRFVEPATTEAQRRYYRTDTRVEVTTTYASGEKFIRRGTITATTGWQPALMLLHRRSDSGSWDLLDKDDVVTAWFDRRGKRHQLEV